MKKLVCTILVLFIVAPLYGQKKTVRAKAKPAVKRTVPVEPSFPLSKPAAVDPVTLGLFVEKYILDVDIAADGASVQTVENRTRFDSGIAIRTFGKFQHIFNGDLEKAEVIDAYILRKEGGRKDTIPAESIIIGPTAQSEAAPAFSSLKMLEIKFNDLKEGDIACYKYRITTHKPRFAGYFDEFEYLPAYFGWGEVKINIAAPQDYPLYFQAVGLEGGRIADENGKARWAWRKPQSEAIGLESAMTDAITPSSRLAVSAFKNYDELGAAVWKATESKARIAPEIAELANRITKDVSDPRQQAYLIYEWVNKNIRYLSVVLDRGGWIPHEASQILQNGYGDCKDYTILLKTLLKAKGIESHPAIIRADMTDWLPDVAVPAFFNHAILYIPSLDLFADATSPNTRLGLIPQSIVGKRAFLAGEKTGIVKTPGDRPGENEILSDTSISFGPDGSLNAISKNTYNGRSEIAFRPLFSGKDSASSSEVFVRMLLKFHGVEGTGRLSRIGNPFKVGEPFEVEMEISSASQSAFLSRGALTVPVGLNLVNMLYLQKLTLEEKRATNLVVGASHVRESILLKFPAGVSITAVPPASVFENAAGSFRSEFRMEGTAVRVLRDLIINKDTTTPADYQSFRELVNTIEPSFNAEIGYEADSAVLKSAAARSKSNPAPRASESPADFAMSVYGGVSQKKLSARDVIRMEASLARDPEDLNTRKRLLAHYYNPGTRKTALTEKTRIQHRVWFIQNHPELDEYDVMGFFATTYTLPELQNTLAYKTFKAEWLKQVVLKPENTLVRLNAVSFVKLSDPAAALEILAEGVRISPEEYTFPMEIANIQYAKALGAKGDTSDKNSHLARALESGETALVLIKKERSGDRDVDRKNLLEKLAKAALSLEKFDRARALATELVLDFGNDGGDSHYEQASHVGNIVLGHCALRNNDVSRAREHLLIAIRAPLRGSYPWLAAIDLELAQKLLEKGEKDAVTEYLRMSISLREQNDDKEHYKADIEKMRSWQEQIKSGKVPRLTFEIE